MLLYDGLGGVENFILRQNIRQMASFIFPYICESEWKSFQKSVPVWIKEMEEERNRGEKQFKWAVF